jgi:RES domain-containing protein
MSLVPHPESERLAEALERCSAFAFSWSGSVFRYADLEFANRRDVASGEGARKSGGRWNPKGGFRVLYASLDLETAQQEIMAHHRSKGLPDAEALPLAVLGFRVEVQRVLDITASSIRRALKLSLNQMRTEPWRALQKDGREAATQAIGRLARDLGFEGLLVPSAARRRGKNLALFPDQLLPGSRIEVVHGERLPLRPRRKKP